MLMEEQKKIYDEFIDSVFKDKAVRIRGEIVLNTASSGIASLLLEGGRTAHSRFGIPLEVHETSMCRMSRSSDLGELVQEAKLIIWDEAPMMSKYCFETLDRSLKDIMRDPEEKPFGVLRLTRNMRLLQNITPSEAREIEEFSKWILNVGEGRLNEPNDGVVDIDIPEELLIKEVDSPIEAIINAIYGEEKIYLSSDSIDPADKRNKYNPSYSPDFLNSVRISGVSNHALRLNIGCPVMLLRNIDPHGGLMNGTRLQITQMADHVIQARIITGTRVGKIVLLPKMVLIPSDTCLPFKMRRRQFPINVAFAMTINKS
ncbi:PREDICTED: uncharacterized protein LOC104705447 [Camelina sativa]|uniref:ATP-dependent DNA helicase n=1 Tax=Camelina sativa TaxID=90675 RepID=A0ABM0T229_CAMSA|nr:PREDICTED: uncharacterized protein LOC104705447 [Camelina sativa]